LRDKQTEGSLHDNNQIRKSKIFPNDSQKKERKNNRSTSMTVSLYLQETNGGKQNNACRLLENRGEKG